MGLIDKMITDRTAITGTSNDVYTTTTTGIGQIDLAPGTMWDSTTPLKAEPQWSVAEEFMLYGAKEWLRGKCGDQVADALQRVKLERRPEIIGHQAILRFADHHANATLEFIMDLRDGNVVGSVFELSGEDILFLKARLDHE